MAHIAKLSNIVQELNQLLYQTSQCDQCKQTTRALAHACASVAEILNQEIQKSIQWSDDNMPPLVLPPPLITSAEWKLNSPPLIRKLNSPPLIRKLNSSPQKKGPLYRILHRG